MDEQFTPTSSRSVFNVINNSPLDRHPLQSRGFQEKVFNALEKITFTCEQNQILLHAISRSMKGTLDVAEIPTNLPEFPLDTIYGLQQYEELLQNNESHWSYLVSSFHCI